MATKALTGLVAEWITPDDQADAEEPTRFKLKPLLGIQFMEVLQFGEHDAAGAFSPDHKARLLLLQYGVKDWENVTDDQGAPFAFNLARLKFLKYNHLIECSNWLLENSALGAEEVKN